MKQEAAPESHLEGPPVRYLASIPGESIVTHGCKLASKARRILSKQRTLHCSSTFRPQFRRVTADMHIHFCTQSIRATSNSSVSRCIIDCPRSELVQLGVVPMYWMHKASNSMGSSGTIDPLRFRCIIHLISLHLFSPPSNITTCSRSCHNVIASDLEDAA